jgi:hypothetical protein
MANLGDDRLPATLPLVKRATERTLLEAMWLLKKAKTAEGVDELVRGFVEARTDPWVGKAILVEAMGAALTAGRAVPAYARVFFAALAEPFAVEIERLSRIATYLELSRRTGNPHDCIEAFDRAGTLPLEKELLEGRFACYEANGDPRLPEARAELQRYRALTPTFGGAVPIPASSGNKTP